MKHPTKITFALLGIFLLAQIVGLALLDHYTATSLPYNIERPNVNAETPFISTGIIIGLILVATLVLLLFIKFRLGFLWKVWFGLAIFLTLSVAFSAVIPSTIALILALIAALLKIFWRNIILHDITEVLIYAAIGAIFAPVLSVLIVILLLIGISIYDYIAVNKTKHMVTLAEYQTQQKLFAGIMIPYKKNVAILGGGDIVFPLLFAGALFAKYHYAALIVSLGAMLGLGTLFYIAQKKKYYPAMPFVTAGCLVGYGVLLLVTYLF